MRLATAMGIYDMGIVLKIIEDPGQTHGELGCFRLDEFC